VTESNEREGSWAKRHEIMDTLKGMGSYGWFHTIIGKKKADGKMVIRLKRFRNWYSIPCKEDYLKVKHMLIRAAISLGWDSAGGGGNHDAIRDMLSETSTLIAEKAKTNEQKQKLRGQISQLRSQLSEYELAFQKLRPEAWKEDLQDFQKLLNGGGPEHDIQDWLYDHLWIFGPHYIEASKQDISRDNDRIDFLLRRYDAFYDVVELKLPSCKLFDGDADLLTSPSRENPISSDVKNAISQVIKYLEEYELDKTNRFYADRQLVHKPKAIIVIGRRDEKMQTALRTLNHYFHGIEILTYDDMLDIGKALITMFEKSRLPKIKKKVAAEKKTTA